MGNARRFFLRAMVLSLTLTLGLSLPVGAQGDVSATAPSPGVGLMSLNLRRFGSTQVVGWGEGYGLTASAVLSETLELEVESIEPAQVVNGNSHNLSVYGSGFTPECVVRLVGYGLLNTTYLNASSLIAQLPAGVPAGTYTLEVSDGVRDPGKLSNALRVTAQPPLPTPEPPPEAPPPGRPILTIRNYRVEPVRVRAGQEFNVVIEIYNNGSRAGENTMAVFQGGSFLPVGEPGHMIWQLHINHTAVVTQRMRAPSSLTSGIHQVQVNLSANDWAGDHYEYPQTVPVEVIGTSTGGGYTGQPKVVIEGVETTPAVLVPGEPFSLTLRLANRGSRTAMNVFATAASSEMAIPARGSDTVSTPRIGIEGVVTVTLPLMLGNVQTGGRQNMAIALAYSDPGGGNYSGQQNIGVDINTSLTRQPQLIIEEYSTEPDFLAPGDTFTLTLRVTNVGGGDAGRLTLALGGEGGAALAPFIPLRSGNVLFVNEVPKGESVVLSQPLIVDGSADAKAYNLPIALAYDDPRASRQEDVQRLSLIVRKRPELQVSFYRQPGMLSVGMPQPLSLEVINVGRSGVNVAGIAVTGEGMELREEGIPFVGPLDAGGSAPLDVLVTPLEGGPAELVIAVRYRDDFNQMQVLSSTLELEVMEGPPGFPGGPEGFPGGPEGGEGPGEPSVTAPETFWQKLGRAVRGFLGFGS